MIYAILEWPLVRLSETLLVLRLPAFVAGALAAGALYWAATGLVSRTEAAAAAWLLAISPYAIADSQLGRPYVLAMLFGIVAYGCLFRVDSDRRYWICYVAALALAGYSNTLAVPLLVAAQTVYVAMKPRYLRTWMLSLAATALLLAPLAAVVAAERLKRDPLYWLTRPTPSDVVSLAKAFMGGGRVLALGVVILIAAAGLRRLWDWRILVFAAWAFGPVVLLFVFAQAEPTFWPSYLLPVLPGVLLLVGCAAVRLPGPLAVVGIVLLTAGFLRGFGHRDPYHPHGLRDATQALVAARHGDPVVFDISDGLTAAGFYTDELAGRDGLLVVSEWGDQAIPANVILLDNPGGYGHVPVGPPTRRLLSRLLKRTGTVFVYVYSTTHQGDVLESPGLLWAARACDFDVVPYGGVRLARLRNCSAVA
jgi:hypothetical protein